MINKLLVYINRLNSSKFLIGVAMLLTNIGSRYVQLNFSKTQEEALRNGLGREMLIFAMMFMATRDLIIAIIMTASFVILADYIFNENSRFCILPPSIKRIVDVIDENEDNIISPEEEKKAMDILMKAKKQKQNAIQSEFNNYYKLNKIYN